MFKEVNWTELFNDTDVVVHLAADPDPKAPWPRVLRDNVEATRNVLDAAMDYRVRRVVFASSNWAVKELEKELAPACYRSGGPKMDSETPPRPRTPYGLSKAFGEVMGRTAVNEQRLESFVAVRIGAFGPNPPKKEPWRDLWISPGDIRSLLRHCVETQFSGFHVVYGVSAQPTAPYDLSYTCELLSWRPRDKIPSIVASPVNQALA
jgi:nucleoside-diphosphate-sugar epimerase